MESYPVTITASLDEELQHTTTASFAGYQPDNIERDEDGFLRVFLNSYQIGDTETLGFMNWYSPEKVVFINADKVRTQPALEWIVLHEKGHTLHTNELTNRRHTYTYNNYAMRSPELILSGTY